VLYVPKKAKEALKEKNINLILRLFFE
jgi:hypothetical protein